MPAWFYILRLKSTRPYCGSTKDKVRRYRNHFAGVGCHTTRLGALVVVAWIK